MIFAIFKTHPSFSIAGGTGEKRKRRLLWGREAIRRKKKKDKLNQFAKPYSSCEVQLEGRKLMVREREGK